MSKPIERKPQIPRSTKETFPFRWYTSYETKQKLEEILKKIRKSKSEFLDFAINNYKEEDKNGQ